MKVIKAIGVAGVMILALTWRDSYAQASDVDASASVSSSDARGAKQQANRALQKSVRRALARQKGLSVANVLVRARDGVVTLQGTVPDRSQIDLATRVAQGVSGVRAVNNAMTVSTVLGQ